MRLTKLSALAVVAAAVLLGRPAAAEHPCAPTVERRLDELRVDRAKIDSIGYGPRTRANTRGIAMLGVDAWIAVSSCRGSLVVKMKKDCVIEEVYTTGDCTLDGIAAP